MELEKVAMLRFGKSFTECTSEELEQIVSLRRSTRLALMEEQITGHAPKRKTSSAKRVSEDEMEDI